MARLVRSIADGAVDVSEDEHARMMLESREELRDAMACEDGTDGLPLSFGSSRRDDHALERHRGGGPKAATKRKKKKPRHAKDRGAAAAGNDVRAVSSDAPGGRVWRAGDVCECYYDGDGLWYMARIDRVQGDIVCVTLVGYEHALSVPGTWLRESARAEEAAHAAAPKIDDVPAGGVPAADDASAADDAPGADDVPAADEQGRRRDVEDASSARPDDAPLDPEQPWAPRTKDPEALRPDGTEDAATDGPAPASASSTAALEAAAAVVPPRSRLSRGADAPNPFPDVDDKYWAQRHHYFSLFDDGILLDAEGWFSVTPERVAAHIASRCGSCVVVDAFCGCGGNAIAFAAAGAHVVAIDIDEARLAYARHNARVYDVAHNIDFVHGDALQLLMSPRLRGKVDVVFLSPPWGGPDYLDAAEFDVRAMRVGDADGFELVRLAAAAAPNVIYFLPRTTTARVARDLAETAANTAAVELESNFLNGKIKAKTLYFGPLFDCAPADDGPRR